MPFRTRVEDRIVRRSRRLRIWGLVIIAALVGAGVSVMTRPPTTMVVLPPRPAVQVTSVPRKARPIDTSTVSQIQQLQFELMKLSSFNEFDGPRVVTDLQGHRSLWRAAMMGRPLDPILPLRDLDQDVWNVDTLMILSSGEDDGALWTLAGSWKADELTWLDQDEAASMFGVSYVNFDGRVLVVWWD